MREHPDSAMSVLLSIDKNKLDNDEEKARHALLMSMALDKNYIDTTTFDVLRQAIDYYLKEGSPDDRLRTLYIRTPPRQMYGYHYICKYARSSRKNLFPILSN